MAGTQAFLPYFNIVGATIPVGFLLFLQIYEMITELMLLTVDDESLAVLTASYLMIGFAVGFPQWLLLRRLFSNSSLWLLGSSIGFGLSSWLVLATDLINHSGVVSSIVAVLAYSLITGLILLRMLTHHNKSRMGAGKPA
jgi:hypothetical protein